MPNTRSANAVRLEFKRGSLIRANLSGAAFTGDWLWVAGEEAEPQAAVRTTSISRASLLARAA